MTHKLLSARLNIARKWKNPDPPTLWDIVDTTHVHFTYEQILALRNKNRDHISQMWYPWLVWKKTNL